MVGFPGKWFPIVAFGWGVVAFTVGWLVACLMSFGWYYVETPAAYAAAFGVVWVLASVYWGLGQIPAHVDDLRRCFLEPNYEAFSDKWKRTFFSNAGMIVCAGVLWLFGGVTAYIGMFDSFPLRLEDNFRRVSHVLPQAWYQGDVLLHYYLFLTISAFACIAGGSGLWLFLVNLPFLASLSKRRVVPLPRAVLGRLRPMSDFYVVGTGAWFVGVGLAAIILFRNLSPVASVFLLVATFIGLTAFVLPQIVFHNLIIRAHSHIANMRIDEFEHLSTEATPRRASELEGIDQMTSSAQVWVFDRSDIMVLLLSGVLAPFALTLISKLRLPY